MRIGLRTRILLIVVLTPLTLGLVALFTVNRSVARHVDSSSLHESLAHAVLVFESGVSARGRTLAGGAEVIARDPRFFSMLTLGVDQRDRRFLATVRGMARDFNGITQTDLFEVLDRRGRRLASVGIVRSVPEATSPLVRQALRGEPGIGVIELEETLYQTCATPVRADGRVVGVLLLGSAVGEKMSRTLRAQMRSEVTFLSDGHVTASTLQNLDDRDALLRDLARAGVTPATDFAALGVLKVKGADLTYLTMVRRIPGSDPATLKLYVMQRALDPETLFLQEMQRQMGLLALIAVAAALITGVLLSGGILRPIRELVRAAQEMQLGNYDQPIRTSGRDELGYLAARFQEMRQRERAYVSGLEEASRRKTEFIHVASHELRTPISVIEGYRNMLESGTLGPTQPQQRQALVAMRGAIDSLTRIAEQATEVARVQGERLALTLAPVEPTGFLERVADDARMAATARRVRVESRVEGAPPTLELDGRRLGKAVFDLLAWGIHRTPDGGRVHVRLREADGGWEIEVRDGGPGFSEPELQGLFERGHTVGDELRLGAPEAGDSGVRLGTVRAVVEAHGGTVSARNHAAGGAYDVRLPRAAAHERAA